MATSWFTNASVVVPSVDAPVNETLKSEGHVKFAVLTLLNDNCVEVTVAPGGKLIFWVKDCVPPPPKNTLLANVNVCVTVAV